MIVMHVVRLPMAVVPIEQKKEKRLVLLDTNMFFLPFKFRVDILSEIDRLVEEPYRLGVASQSAGELSHLLKKKGTGRGARAAAVFLNQLVAEGRVAAIPSVGRVDDWLFRHARQNQSIVCTNDILLKLRLKRAKLKVIALRQQDHLAYA